MCLLGISQVRLWLEDNMRLQDMARNGSLRPSPVASDKENPRDRSILRCTLLLYQLGLEHRNNSLEDKKRNR